MKKLKVLDLFSGIGGFSLGLERTGGFETVAFCEIEKFPQKVLRKHWPEVPIFEDVRKLDATGLGRIDCVVGGFPCQPWSLAGERKGTEDDRDLWKEMLRVITNAAPEWVIGENVRGFVNEKMGLERSISDLEDAEYKVQTFIVPACAVGASHRRDRVWIIAHANRQRLFEDEVQSVINYKELRQRWTIDHDLSSRIKRGSQNIRGNDGFSTKLDEARVKAIGNAVVPQIPEMIGRAILKSYES